MKQEFAEIDDKTKAVFAKKGYQLLSKLGQGAFGQVYKARNIKRNPQQECAVKVMDMRAMSAKVRDKFLPRELGALMEVKHPYIIAVHDIFRMSSKIYVFMEFAANGDLSAYVKRHKALKEPLARVWFTQTGEAMQYLHEQIKMAHRDIKLDNILLNHAYEAKLTDFGFASLITDDETDICSLISVTFCGTVPYYCPQLVARKPYNPFKADVWALAVVLYAMLCNRFPYHFQDVKTLYREQCDYPKFVRSRLHAHLSVAACDLLEKMLDPDEKRRPMISEVLAHEWLIEKSTTH